MSEINGIYACYMAGLHDQGFMLIMLRDGVIARADPFGVTFDGVYSRSSDGPGYKGRIEVRAPPGGTTIQGVQTGPSGLQYFVDVVLPDQISSEETLEIKTPLGPVNARLSKIRGL